MTQDIGNPLWRHTATRDNGAAFMAHRSGHQASITPLTEVAEAWLRANVDEEASWLGDHLIVEMRYFPALADAIIRPGSSLSATPCPTRTESVQNAEGTRYAPVPP